MVIILDAKTFLWLNIEAKINLWKSLARTFVLRLLNFVKREGPLCTLLDPCPLWDAKGQRCKKKTDPTPPRRRRDSVCQTLYTCMRKTEQALNVCLNKTMLVVEGSHFTMAIAHLLKSSCGWEVLLSSSRPPPHSSHPVACVIKHKLPCVK